MGNSGSVGHNIHMDEAELNASELSTFKQQVRLTKKSGVALRDHNVSNAGYQLQWRKSASSILKTDSYMAESTSQITRKSCKVLPQQLNETFKLRATSNGAILHSGGTISGRKGQLSPPLLTQRAHTFIYEPKKEVSTTGINSTFKRSQTLLHLNYNAGGHQTMILESKPSQNRTTGNSCKFASSANRRTVKATECNTSEKLLTSMTDAMSSSMPRPVTRKYNKKRKAPQAPLTKLVSNNSGPKIQHAAFIAGNSTPNPQMLQRNQELRCSLRSHKAEKNVSLEKYTFRREKSSDAIMLVQQRSSLATVSQQRQQDEHKNLDPQNISETGKRVQSSKIPQLKRTFYFGMNAKNNEMSHKRLPLSDESLQLQTSNYTTDNIVLTQYKDDCVGSNGITVHMRPTLPRRILQLQETPTFSASTAWRKLEDAERKCQANNNRINNYGCSEMECCDKTLETPWNGSRSFGKTDGGVQKEKPILLASSLDKGTKVVEPLLSCQNAWTPEQDLEDDDDDDDDEVVDGRTASECYTKNKSDSLTVLEKKHANSLQPSMQLHMFSLSLPRDVNFQTHTNQFASLHDIKSADFSSLQKLRNTTTNSKGNNRVGGVTKYHDNWVLHKLEGQNQHCRNNSVQLQGKHIMYLPVGNDQNNNTNNNNIALKKIYKPKEEEMRPKSLKKKEMRQSLQDATPLTASHKPNNRFVKATFPSAGVIDEKPSTTQSHRFSFQSTIRLLEKKRLAEKLARAAEVREAQRLNELKAMERVEEDFQRKRAYEKANIRQQLRDIYDIEAAKYNSLPILDSSVSQHDRNNNVFGRVDPEGAVSAPNAALYGNKNEDTGNEYKGGEMLGTQYNYHRDDFVCKGASSESENELKTDTFNHMKAIVEPYLQSIIK